MKAGPLIAGGAVLLGAVALASRSEASSEAGGGAGGEAGGGAPGGGGGGSFWDKFKLPKSPAPPPPPPGGPLPPQHTYIRPDLIPAARAAARANGVPEDGFIKQMWVESRFDPVAYNPGSGALGIGQFIVVTGNDYGLITGPEATSDEYKRRWRAARGSAKRDADRWYLAQPGVVDRRADPVRNVQAAARFMRNLKRMNLLGTWALAAAGYNRGPWNIQQWQKGNQSLPKETADYAAHVAPWYGPLPGATA